MVARVFGLYYRIDVQRFGGLEVGKALPPSPYVSPPGGHYNRIRRAMASVATVLLMMASAGIAGAEERAPWRLGEHVPVPPWLELGLIHRLRVERLNNDYRAGSTNNSTILAMRTLISAAATWRRLVLRVELQDSRVYANDDAPLTTTSVNALEPLQAYLGFVASGLLFPGDSFRGRLGRITMDVGSRRLAARNRYRNTINNFAGLDLTWQPSERQSVRLFGVFPMVGVPSGEEQIRANTIARDRTNTDALFWGIWATNAVRRVSVELYTLGYYERDGDIQTSNRQLLTPGLRVFRQAAPGNADFELETAVQVGSSRASRSTDDLTSLHHRAFFFHGEAGVSLDTAWAPRLAIQFDYASGDEDPDDGKNGRFTTLFGARRWEFGPTGIYGPFARGNLVTPGIRFQTTPCVGLAMMAAHRVYGLAQARDRWITAGLQDSSGNSGRFLGQQTELRVRWNLWPKNLAIDVGAAYLGRGSFAQDAPQGNDDSSTYFYAQTTGSI